MKPGEQKHERDGSGLFVQIPFEVLHDLAVSHAAKLTYGRLLFYAGRDGRCNPAQETLAAEVCLSDRQIRNVLKELHARGWITWKRTRTSCSYDITGPVPERKETSDLDMRDRKKTSGEIGNFLPVRSEETFLQKDLRKDHGKEGANTDLDYQTMNGKKRDSSPGGGGQSRYPHLREALSRYRDEDGQESITPTERTVVDVMHAAGGATEGEVIACLKYLREDRGLKSGTHNGPEHWAWFKTVVADHFAQERARALCGNRP